jgi:hypothetical protein
MGKLDVEAIVEDEAAGAAEEICRSSSTVELTSP